MKLELHYRLKCLASCALVTPLAVQAGSDNSAVNEQRDIHDGKYAPASGVLS